MEGYFVLGKMTRTRSRLNLSDEEKRKRRREQKKMSMRRARAKLDLAALEERRRQDRERYKRKKEEGLIRTIKDFTPREQRQIRKIWREKSKLRRDKEKVRKQTQGDLNSTPSSSSISSFSRVAVGRATSAQNRRRLKAKNKYLSSRLKILEKKLAKYRMRVLRLKRKKDVRNTDKVNVKQRIHDFLLEDENSRLTAGKKETITRRKEKRQIRLLNDSLLNLHKKFLTKTGLNISYETFRRHRPFWVIFPKAATRNTCLCSIHSNSDYITHALYHAKVLPYLTTTDVAKSLCCNNVLNVSCLERKCTHCSEKTVNFNLINNNDTILYQRWVTKNVTVVVKGREKQCKKTLKETVKTSQQLLVNTFKLNLPKFMQHLANIKNQFQAIRLIKQNLSPTDGLLHIDFSENYGYKYGTEIQSAHFGGSKGQLSLHTCVYYYTKFQPPQNIIETKSICTVSENLRHDPVLICAHLKPVIEKIHSFTPSLKSLHILSDGPSTQYRNKTMFFMTVNYLSKISNAESITWHFTETGHGKGAPDGVGGCLKRICDNFVANGGDITNIDTFVDCATANCKSIDVIPIDDTYVPDIQNIADASTARPFKGTFKIHQISWSSTEPNILHARRLSCIQCPSHAECSHFEIGQIPVRDISLSETPSHSPSRGSSPSSAVSILEPASTVSGPRTPELFELFDTMTPSPEPSLSRKPFTPRKRFNFENIYSDSSESPSSPKILKRPTNYSDGDQSTSKVTRTQSDLLIDTDDENSPLKITKKRLRITIDDEDRQHLLFKTNNAQSSHIKIPYQSNIDLSDDSDENIF